MPQPTQSVTQAQRHKDPLSATSPQPTHKHSSPSRPRATAFPQPYAAANAHPPSFLTLFLDLRIVSWCYCDRK
ncbi:hypothetical protein JHK87_012034 [Glycine soja]|nr:hypothetical protein JHK87_012034 [Glycine soja]